MHPVSAVFISFWFAAPVFLVGYGAGSRRIGLVVLPWLGVWSAARLFGGMLAPIAGAIAVAMALAFWLGWVAGAGRWITELPRGRRGPSGWAVGVVAALAGGFGGLTVPGRAPTPMPAAAPTVAGPDRPGGIFDRAGLLTGEPQGHAAHYVTLLAGKGFTYRIETAQTLPALWARPGPRGVVLEAAASGHGVRIAVGVELAGLLTAEQCALLAADASRELASGNRLGAFWSVSEALWGILAEGRRPPGRLTAVQVEARRASEAPGAYTASVFVSLFTLGIGMLLGAAVFARNLLWAAVASAFAAGSLGFFVHGWIELGLWWPVVIPVLAMIVGIGIGGFIVRRRPGLLRPDPPLPRWAWGVRFAGSRGRSGGGFGGYGGGRSGGAGASGRV